MKLAVDYFIFTQMRGLAVRFPHCRHAVARNVKVVAVGVGINAFQPVEQVHFFAVVTESNDSLLTGFNVYELIVEAAFSGNRIAFHIGEGNAEMNRTVGVNENIERFALGIVVCNSPLRCLRAPPRSNTSTRKPWRPIPSAFYKPAS